MRNLFELLRSQDMEPVWCWPVGRDWRSEQASIPRKGTIDAVVVNGEGSIHHSARRQRAVWLAELGRFSNEQLGVPAYLINATLESNDASLYKNLKYFRRIYVRENKSLSEIVRYGLRAEVVPDLTMSFPRLEKFQRKGYLVTDSALREVTKKLLELGKRLGATCMSLKYPQAPALDELRRPWIYVKRRISWRQACKEGCLESDFMIRRIAGVEGLVTGRFHAITVALLTGTPFWALESNTWKISSLLDDALGSQKRLIAADQLETLSFNDIPPFSEEERANLERYLQLAQTAPKRMVREIADDLL